MGETAFGWSILRISPQEAYEPQNSQDSFGEGRPEVKLDGSISGGGDNSRDLEKGVAETFEERAVHVEDVHRDGQHSGRDNKEVNPQFLRAEHLPETLDQEEVVKVEVHAEQEHKNANHNVKIRVVVRSDAEIAAAEAAGARRTEGMDAGVKQGHPAQAEEDDFHHRHGKVDTV